MVLLVQPVQQVVEAQMAVKEWRVSKDYEAQLVTEVPRATKAQPVQLV